MRKYYSHLWCDMTFEANLESNYGMISYTDLGQDSEEVIFYQSTLCPGVYELGHGKKIPINRSTFTIAEMIEYYQDIKTDVDKFAGQSFPTVAADYIAGPYLILMLADIMQTYSGWLDDCPEPGFYSLTEIKRLLGAYN